MTGTPEAAKLLSEAAEADPSIQPFAVESSVIQEAFKQALIDALRFDEDFRQWVAAQVRQEVAEQASKSQHVQTIKAEVTRHLEHYPAIGSDPGLQDAISKAIVDYMMKPVR